MQYLKEILSQFDMLEGEGGLVFVDDIQDRSKDIAISEILSLHEALKFSAVAVYFRRFDNQSSIPQAYIYDAKLKSDKDWVEIHTRLWSSGVVPMFIVISDYEFKIYNCTYPVKIKKGTNIKETQPFEIIKLGGIIFQEFNKRFSGRYLDNGSFWELPRFKNVFNSDKSPFKLLLEDLKILRKEVLNKIEVSNETINKLLVMCILVKYLEEKKDEKTGTKLFEIERDFLKGYTKFTDILRAKGRCLDFFDALAQKFNGRVFEWNKELESINRQELADKDWSLLANYLDGDFEVEKKQYLLWEQYSFNDLPVELISGIYEALLPERDGVVYTPPHLVYFLIDQCMPLEQSELFKDKSFKVLDPSCGSGVFLVGAYRRMIQWQMLNEYKQTSILKEPDLETHIEILKNNIYGVDIEKDATRIAIFSLVIALCDNLTPLSIWHDLKLPDLNQDNIATKDFFQFFHETDRNFDLVIGNPPFNPPLNGDNKKYTNIDYLKEVESKYYIKTSSKIPNNNVALLFLDRAIRLCKDRKSICLILPSSSLLYSNTSSEFRKYFFETNNVKTIYDFTHLRNVLFHGSASVSVCAIIANNELPDQKDVEHIVIKRTSSAEERILFETDTYDAFKLPFDSATKNQFIWKTNLKGGGRLLSLIEKINNYPSFQDFLTKKERESDWVVAQGYATKPKPNTAEEVLLKLGYKKASYITNQKVIDTDSLTEDKAPSFYTETETYFRFPREDYKNIYEPPHLLIRQNLGKTKIPTYFSDEYLCFKEKIIGIHAPQEEREELLKIQKYFEKNAEIYRFMPMMTSSQIGITRHSALLKTDIENLPYLENEEIKLSFSEKIVVEESLKYMNTLGNATSNSELCQILTISVKDDLDFLKAFGETFCKILNPVYRKNNMQWQVGEIVETPTYLCYGFCYGQSLNSNIAVSEKFDIEDSLKTLIENNAQKSVKKTRILRGYFHQDGYDKLYLIKPKHRRYWLRSIAIWDADETFEDLIKAGY